MNRTAMIAVILLLSAAVCLAQGTTGKVEGLVTDASGAVLPGATVVILNTDTGLSRTVQTDANGRYSAPALSLGNYKVTASLTGFQTEIRSGISLTLGRDAVVDLRLTVGAVTQTLEVTGEAPLVETSQSAVSSLVNSTTINELPLNGRSLSDLVLLQPGVAKLEFAATAAHRGFGTQINISGMRSDDNAWLLDGTDIVDYQNNAPVGPNAVMYGVSSVREFQVETNNYGAQFGRSLGGVFNAVSRGGTNQFHGEAYDFLRNSDLDARDFFDGARNPFRRNQFGGDYGGPIKKDRAFFYANYEGLRSNKTTTAIATVPGVALRQGIVPGLALPVTIVPQAAAVVPYWPLPTPGRATFSDGTAQYAAPTPLVVQSDFGQVRFDEQLSDKDSFFARFTILDQSQTQTEVYAGYYDITPNSTRFATASETHIFSPRDLNTFRVAFNRTALFDFDPGPNVPALQYFPGAPWPGNLTFSSGVTGFSLASGLWPYFFAITNRPEVVDDVTMTRGNHSISFGFDYQHVEGNQAFPNVPQGAYTFSSFANFLQGTGASLFRGTPLTDGTFERGFRQWFYSSYFQDDWRVFPRLTLNLGVRFDYGSVIKEVNGLISTFKDSVPGGDYAATGQIVIGNPLYLNPFPKFSPRFGFAWTPMQKYSTTVRGGFGIYYGRIDFRDYWGNRDGLIAPSLAVSNPTHFPNAIAELSGPETTQILTSCYACLKAPHTLQWSLNVEQQLGASTLLTLGYVGNRGLDLISIGNPNAPQSYYVNGILTVPSTATVRNPKLNVFDLTSSSGDSWYNGLTALLKRRLSAGLQMQVSYTYSKSLCTSEQTSRAQLTSNQTSGYFLDPAYIGADKGLCSWDARNVFVFNYVYQLPWGPGQHWASSGPISKVIGGWETGGVLTVRDGNPYTYMSAISAPLSADVIQQVRPNAIVGNPVGGIILGTPNETCSGHPCTQYYSPSSFSFPSTYQLGNLGRNTGTSPGLADFDISLQKTFQLSERFKLLFRAEAFNLFNRPNFGLPARSVFGPTGAAVGNAGVITAVSNDGRQLQFGLKLNF